MYRMEEQNRVFGCIKSPVDLRDYKPVLAITGQLPDKFMIETNNNSVLDQGSIGSCVAHSLAALLEIEYKDTYSTGWIYGYRPFGYTQGIGMSPREALKTLQKVGNVPHSNFPENIEMNDAKKLVDQRFNELKELAGNCKIAAYAKLSGEGEIKTFLYNNKVPIPIAISTKNMELDNLTNTLMIPNVHTNSSHMIIIIGWNETGFIVQNSWGKSWGINGTATLPYEYKINEAWGITLKQDTQNPAVKKPFFYFIRELIMKGIQSSKLKKQMKKENRSHGRN